MKSSEVVGRKIVRVNQERYTQDGEVYYEVQSFVLDNGKVIKFVALETDYEPIVVATVR